MSFEEGIVTSWCWAPAALRSREPLNPTVEAVTRLASCQLTLESGNQLPAPMQVCERLALGGAVDDDAGVVAERVVDADDLVLADAHWGLRMWGTGACRTGRGAWRLCRALGPARRIPLRSPAAPGQVANAKGSA